MKILVVFTGGTIGSSQKDGFVSTDGGKPYRILELYKTNTNSDFGDICIESAFPYEELSENLTCALLGKLIVFLRDNCLNNDYDGIIVTHGTDTLQYTAAALSYCFGDLNVPLVLVSSNYILEDSRANGVANFSHAVGFIASGNYGGVYISYKSDGECAKIHCGERVISHKAYSDAVESLYGIEYGYFDDGKFMLNNAFHGEAGDTATCRIFRDSFDAAEYEDANKDENAAEYEDTKKDGNAAEHKDVMEYENAVEYEDIMEYEDATFSDIMWIRPYVGMRYPKISDNVKAVLHDTFHSGTICSKLKDLEDFAAEAKSRGIQVFVCGCGDSAMYESKKVYERLGFNVLPVASPIAMYVKLWLCVRSGLDLRETMKRKICRDIYVEKRL